MNIILGIISIIVIFSSLVLIEKLFKKEGLFSQVLFIVIMQLALAFIPDATDVSHEAMK